jgi:hypothetical protein
MLYTQVSVLVKYLDLRGGPLVGQAQQDHTPMHELLAKDDLAEVLVVGDDDAIFGQGARQDGRVVGPAVRVEDRDHVVALRRKPPGHGRPGAFIHEKPQLRGLRSQRDERGAVERLRSEEQTGEDVLAREPLVLGEDLLDGLTGGQETEDELDREAGASDHRLSDHDLRVDGDSLQELVSFHGCHRHLASRSS